MQKVLCTTLLAAGVASGDLLEIAVDGVADTSYGDFAGSLFLDTDTGSLTGDIFLPAVQTPTGAYPGTVTFDGLYSGEATSGETSQGSVTGPQYVGDAVMSFPFLGGFDLGFDVVFGDGLSLGDSGLGVTYLSGNSPFGPLEATLSFNYSVVPAPGAIALLGLAGLGRRRRS